MVLVSALLAVPVMAQGIAGNGGVDILGQGIFETNGAAFKFADGQDTNSDNLVIGNDRALSTGWAGFFPFDNNGPAVATNDLEVKKNQDSGVCNQSACCPTLDAAGAQSCHDCCVKVNLESIKIGDRTAQAFGLATATNHVKVVTNQQ